jgi:hypothetical protein
VRLPDRDSRCDSAVWGAKDTPVVKAGMEVLHSLPEMSVRVFGPFGVPTTGGAWGNHHSERFKPELGWAEASPVKMQDFVEDFQVCMELN